MASQKTVELNHQFGNWTVIGFPKKGETIHSSREKLWQPTITCRCVCGTVKDVWATNLLYGKSKGCGCNFKELAKKKFTTHGRTDTKEYLAWLSMKNRCLNDSHQNYKNYGGRGIKVCDKWRNDFDAFLKDMGEAPSKKHSIDRIDVNGNYEPKNCKWSTPGEQARNKRLANNSLRLRYGKHHFEIPWYQFLGSSSFKRLKANLEKIEQWPFINYSWDAHYFVLDCLKKGREEKISGEKLRQLKRCGVETVEFIFNLTKQKE